MRTKPEYFYTQSGVIPYRMEGGVMRLLLITSRSGRRWVIPKGVIEPHLSPAVSAAKEALEEAGITGHVHPRSMGSYQRQKWGGTCTVEVFAMAVEGVLDEWEESYRRRQWMTVDEAAACVEERALAQLMSTMPAFIAGLVREG